MGYLGKRARASYLRAAKRRRTTLRKARRRTGRFPRGLKMMNVHHFKRTYQGSTYQASSAGTNPNAFYVTFGALPNYTEFTSLFDMYRINCVVFKLVPSVSGLDLNPVATTCVLPNIHSALDYDDSNNPTLATDLMQYNNYKMTRGNQVHTRTFRPSVCLDADGTGSTAPKWKQWLNLAATNAEHRGVKFLIEQADGISAGSLSYKSYITVYFSCKGVR